MNTANSKIFVKYSVWLFLVIGREGLLDFNLLTMFLYLFPDVFAVVTRRSRKYRLAVYCDETVPPFGPTLPNPPEFEVSFMWALI